MKLSAPALSPDLLPGLPAIGGDIAVDLPSATADFSTLMLELQPGAPRPAALGSLPIGRVPGQEAGAGASTEPSCPPAGPRLDPRPTGGPARAAGPALRACCGPAVAAVAAADTPAAKVSGAPDADAAAAEAEPATARRHPEAPTGDSSAPAGQLLAMAPDAGTSIPDVRYPGWALVVPAGGSPDGTVARSEGASAVTVEPELKGARAPGRHDEPAAAVGEAPIRGQGEARWSFRPEWDGGPGSVSPRMPPPPAAMRGFAGGAGGMHVPEGVPPDATELPDPFGVTGPSVLPAPAAEPRVPGQLPPEHTGEAKLADPDRRVGGGRETAPGKDHKIVDTQSEQQVATSREQGGTGVALRADTMPFPPPEVGLTSPLESILPIRGITAAPAFELPPAGEVQPDPEVCTDASRAVAAVFTAAELARQGERSSVTLRFALGEADLSVRVAVRDQEVHATFATDSADLRAALAQECSVAASEPGRVFRFSADITTGGGDSAGFSSFGGDAAAGRREDRREAAGGAFPGWRPRIVEATPAVTAPQPGVRANSVHLHTLA